MTARLAELEDALAVAAYIVVRHGDVYMPVLERLERAIEDEQKHTSNRDRAQRILADLMKRREVRVGPAA